MGYPARSLWRRGVVVWALACAVHLIASAHAIDNLLTMVNIALGTIPISEWRPQSGQRYQCG